MNDWIKVCDRLPELGKRVLCHRKGDIYVAMRFEDKFVPIPFAKSKYSIDLCRPDSWSEIDFPDGLTGKMLILPKDSTESIDMETYKRIDPKGYYVFAKMMIESLGKGESDER